MAPNVFQRSESYESDRLIAGLTQVATWDEVLVSGQNLKRGAIVGRISDSGKVALSISAATDGSQVPFGILASDYDASAADLGNVGVYVEGEFNENAVILGSGHTVASVRDALRDVGILLKRSTPS